MESSRDLGIRLKTVDPTLPGQVVQNSASSSSALANLPDDPVRTRSRAKSNPSKTNRAKSRESAYEDRKQRAANRRTASPFVITEPDHDDQQNRSFVNRLLSGWLTSLVLHALICLFLAIVVSTTGINDQISLQFSASSVELSDDELDNSLIEVSSSSLSQDEELTVELQELALEPEILVEPEFVEETQLTSFTDAFADTANDSGFEPVQAQPIDKAGGGNKEAEVAQNSGKAKFFGIESKGNDFVFVLDCSGSMSEDYRYERAVYELRQTLSKLHSEQSFLVILYNINTIPMLGMPVSNLRLLPASDRNKDRVLHWLSRQTPNAYTYPQKAMQLSLGLSPDAIYLLSDGKIQDRTVEFLRSENIDDRYNDQVQIPVNTISLGDAGIGTDIMRLIAKDNRGKFIWSK